MPQNEKWQVPVSHANIPTQYVSRASLSSLPYPESDPCDDENAVYLPQNEKCQVPMSHANVPTHYVSHASLSSTPYPESDPCDDENAVYLPQNGKCLVPVKNAKDWVQAQKTCEQRRGDLYRLPKDGQLTSDSRLARCLAAMPANDQLGNDFWIGAVSAWSRHWFWVNSKLGGGGSLCVCE